MVLRRDLQDGGNWRRVSIDNVSDQLGQVLVDQNDVDVVALDEPLETVLDFTHGRVWKVIN